MCCVCFLFVCVSIKGSVNSSEYRVFDDNMIKNNELGSIKRKRS